jgi:hypothetical protein
MKIEIEVSELNEGTSAPWWIIVDPRQSFEIGIQGVLNISQMVTGPFFSREEAENELQERRYDYGKSAAVHCRSGYHSRQYYDKIQAARKHVEEVCEWWIIDDPDPWIPLYSTACEHLFRNAWGHHEDYKASLDYCPFCGKKIKPVKKLIEESEDEKRMAS